MNQTPSNYITLEIQKGMKIREHAGGKILFEFCQLKLLQKVNP